MIDNLILGIDTSNYTTSAALLTDRGELVSNIKLPLSVGAGERGLRQSDAVFAHIKNLPVAFSILRDVIADKKIVAVGVSERPRNINGSYMPCFLSGVSAAEGISAAAGIPLYRFSHQCGHIMAAVYSSSNLSLLEREFAACHISGGTTELLRINSYTEHSGFCAELLGGTKDLNAGQVIDRIGVLMGLGFPAGAELERLALSNTQEIPKKKISIDGLRINLSGLENMAKALYEKTKDKALTSAFVLEYVSNSIIAMSSAYEQQFGKASFVYAGGVMSNSIIKDRIIKSFDACFAEPKLSSDNAVGIAYLAYRAHFSKK